MSLLIMLHTSLWPEHNIVYRILEIFQKYMHPKDDWHIGVHMKVKWAIIVMIIMTVTEAKIANKGEEQVRHQKTSKKPSVVFQD